MLFPEINPIAFYIFGVSIKWYGLSYALGLLIGIWNCKRVIIFIPGNTNKNDIENLLLWVALGIIIGGRLGYVIFYSFDYFISNPLDIVADIRKGGMSFHGGLIGTIISSWFYAKKNKLNYLQIMDSIACSAPLGIFLGRIANFINSELWGKVTNMPWGIVFPNGGSLARHPSQLYEAVLEGLVLLIFLNWLVKKKLFTKPGIISGIFLIFYSSSRIFLEFFRVPDAHIGYIYGPLSLGIILSIPMFFLGIFLIKK